MSVTHCNTNHRPNQLTRNRTIYPEPSPLQLARALALLFLIRGEIEADVRQACQAAFENTDKASIAATRADIQNLFRMPLDKVISEARQEGEPHRTEQHVEDAID